MNVFTLTVNTTRCISCGACARECLAGKTGLTLGTDGCTGCLHCHTICPVNAISVSNAPTPEAPADVSSIGVEELTFFLASRMSTRHFLPAELDPGTLGRLVDAARYTPSGGNRRAHELTVLPRGRTREVLLEQLKRIYTKKSALLNNPFLRTVLRPFVGPYLRAFLDDRRYGGIVSELLEKLRRGEDPIFYDAPTVILFHSRVLIPTPKEDCLLAAHAMALAAHASGLGTCFVTLAQSAVNSSKVCKEILGLSRGDDVHAVLLAGHPAVRFLRPAPRPPLPVRTAGRE